MKEFNVTGVCVSEKHYMVDIGDKLKEIISLIEKDKYFTMNRARQYGKTTTLMEVFKALKDKYVVVDISFEGVGNRAFSTEQLFIETFINLVSKRLKQIGVSKSALQEWEKEKDALDKIEDLSDRITQLSEGLEKEIILLIDEVDKSSNNQLFLHFLGMLRNKYLDREKGYDKTFKSVILAGVYDIKNLKLKLRPDEERKYNSPWNIATEFEVDMSFNPREIGTMLVAYEKDHKTGMNIEEISNEIYNYTSGYPFLVSKICKVIHEKLDMDWTLQGLQEAVKIILDEKNTLFDDLIKNLENNKDLYKSIYNQLVLGEQITYNIDNPNTNLGVMFGYFKKEDGKRVVHNKIFEQRIYAYMASKLEDSETFSPYNFRQNFIDEKGNLNVERILEKFQQMMKEEYSARNRKFLEREGRLLFIAFLRPIINGKGFAFKEVQISEEQRLDIVITYNHCKYVIELKRWYGEEYHQKGIKQLEEYLEGQNLDKGYLVIFSFNKNKKYLKEWIKQGHKDICAVVV